MKTLMILIIAVVGLAIASCNQIGKSIKSNEKGLPTSLNRYRYHELIVIYKSKPTPAAVNVIKREMAAINIDIGRLVVKKCNECNDYVELWYAENIHRILASDSLPGGTVSPKGSLGAGEDLAYFSLNFLSNVPVDSNLGLSNYKEKPIEFSSEGKDTITVAVLDTGIDTRLVSPNLLWKNRNETENTEDDDGNCYADDIHGWNFIKDSSDVTDDNLHGTLVSHYIINEFVRSPRNFVQIMSLKTHNEFGYGDLFSTICALHYAMNKGANIINASWGFYYYTKGSPHPYLDKLITRTMREKGILFVTAAGNQEKDDDRLFKEAYDEIHEPDLSETMLRNLEYHSFYPACLSRRGKNVVTVTTTDGTEVSPTQNYSEKYVDIGVMRDVDDANIMKFKTRFPGPTYLIGGSSFATAIASGKVGAYFPKSMYLPGLAKDDVFEEITAATPDGITPFITFETVMSKELIKKGAMTYPK